MKTNRPNQSGRKNSSYRIANIWVCLIIGVSTTKHFKECKALVGTCPSMLFKAPLHKISSCRSFGIIAQYGYWTKECTNDCGQNRWMDWWPENRTTQLKTLNLWLAANCKVFGWV